MADAGRRPNVLLICTDHWSGLLTRPAGHPVVMTPTVEQMSRNGVTFEQAYSACPSCIPARRSLMTGMNARSHGDRTFMEQNPLPDAPTLAGCFREGGYQTFCVGKLHVYPQRDRVGFDEVILEEQGRHQFDGRADDWEIFLAERGHAGMEYASGMSHNDFLARPWHLPEDCHPVNWAVREMSKAIHRRDPRKPGFWYLSFSAPHPPLTPPREYLDIYRDVEIDRPSTGDWSADPSRLPYTLRYRNENMSAMVGAPWHEQRLARRAFYATLTHIDNQMRLMIGLLREQGLLDDTIIVFTSDHGHMLGEHGLWCMTPLYEMSAKIPLIIMPPAGEERLVPGTRDTRLAEFGDLMPTLLDLCGLPVPPTADGLSLAGDQRREHLYGEHFAGDLGTRMIRAGRYKLIYYAAGNRSQLFDLEADPRETRDLAGDPAHAGELKRLQELLMGELYGGDEDWVRDGELVGVPEPAFDVTARRDMITPKGMGNQRGLRFP